MNQKPFNPYATSTTVVDNRTRLSFEGVIDEVDYARLLPRRDAEWLLYTILLVLLSLTTTLVLSAVITGLILRGWDNVVVPAIVIGLATAAGTVFTIRHRRPLRRAKRSLERFPDLLGVARGELTEAGLAFHDGVHQHWFGPQLLVASVVSPNGIRIFLDADPRRFLALTSRMFDHYSEEVASRLKLSWCAAARDVTSPDLPAGLALWQELNPLPDNAVSFRGTVTIHQPLRTTSELHAVMIESSLASSLLLVGLLGNKFFGSLGCYGLIGCGALLFAFNGRSWWRYFRGMNVQSWNQQGWISSNELAILTNCTGVRLPLSELQYASDHGDLIALVTQAGGSYHVARDHVHSDDAWIQLKNRIGAVGIENR